jgi:intein/homing endonuclease
MRIVEPTVDEIVFHIPEGYATIEQWLERCGRTCFHPDTEVLTDSGWKPIPIIGPEDRVLTFNQQKHSLEYQPSNIVCKEFDGFLLSSQHRNVKFRVTPDHRIVACKAHYRDISKPYKFIKAQDLLEKNNNNGWRVPKFFGMPGTSKHAIIKDRYPAKPTFIKTDDYTYESGKPKHSTTLSGKEYEVNSYLLTILAAYIAEGYIGKPKGSGSYIGITQSTSEELYILIEEALYELGMDFSIVPDPRKPYIHTFRIREGRPFVEWVEKHCGRYSENKVVPEFVRTLPNHMIEKFLKVLYMGDGSGNTTRTERYLSVNKTLVDQVQELWILIGKNASVGFMNSEHWKNCDGIFYTEESQRDSWIIKPDHLVKEKYKGKVYCPSTKNGIVCIRNNDKAMWIGNCYKSENKITEESAPKFVRMLRNRGHHAMLEHAVASARFIGDRGLCYDDQTEVLTYNGWKKFEDTTEDDRFLTINTKTEGVEYQKRLDYTEEDWDGELICGNSTMVNFAVTPNHRMFWFHYDSRKDRNWKINKAEEIYGRRVKFLRGLFRDMGENCFHKESPYTYLYPQIHKLDFARFMGIWITDGSLWKGKDTGGRVTITQTKESGRKYIKKVLKGLGWKFHEKPEGFRINNTKLYDFLRKWFPADQKKTYTGRCPTWIRHANSKYIRAFLEGVIVGDGNIHKSNGHVVVYTASYGFAGDLQELFMKAGLCASIRTDDRRGQSRVMANGTTITNKVVQYIVSVNNRTNEHLFNKKHWFKKHYKGKVRCVTVPNGTLYVRREGKSFWSGNTHELVRHRLASYAQESTRYCNYSKGKFNNEITVIEYPWKVSTSSEKYQKGIELIEKLYMELLADGEPPELARAVLPISLKAEILMTANLREWLHVFHMRCDTPAHPIIRGCALEILKAFNEKLPYMYENHAERFLND